MAFTPFPYPNRDAVISLPDRELLAVIRSTNPSGRYAQGYEWAVQEWRRRESQRAIADRVDGYDRDDLGESPDY